MATQLGRNIIRRFAGSRLLQQAGGNLGAGRGIPGLRGARSYSTYGSTSTMSNWWIGPLGLSPFFLWWLNNRRVAELDVDQKEQLKRLLPQKQVYPEMKSELRDKLALDEEISRSVAALIEEQKEEAEKILSQSPETKSLLGDKSALDKEISRRVAALSVDKKEELRKFLLQNQEYSEMKSEIDKLVHDEKIRVLMNRREKFDIQSVSCILVLLAVLLLM